MDRKPKTEWLWGLAFGDAAISTLSSREMLNPPDDRHGIDAIIFEMLDPTQGEGDGVYAAVVNLVKSRLRKARSLRGR